MALGAFLNNRKQRKWSHYIEVFCVGIVLLIAESYVVVLKLYTMSTILWLSCPIVTLGFFKIFEGIKINWKTNDLRKISSWMYFSHCLWIYVFGTQTIMKFMLVLASSIASGVIVVWLSRKYKLLKYLY